MKALALVQLQEQSQLKDNDLPAKAEFAVRSQESSTNQVERWNRHANLAKSWSLRKYLGVGDLDRW
ncbi:hypothetical protein D3C87_1393610 [compost metagenome]